MDKDESVRINITSGAIIKTIIIIILLWVFYLLFDLVLVLLTSVVIASAIEPAAKWLMKYKIPRTISVIIIYLSTFLIVVGIIYSFLPPIIENLSGLSQKVPEYLDSINIENPITNEGIFSQKLLGDTLPDISVSETINSVVSYINTIRQSFFHGVSSVFGGALSLMLIVVISFYLAVQDRGIEKFLRLVVPVHYESYVLDLWSRSQTKIGLWLQGQLVLALIIGLLVYLGLTILGVEYAFILGLLAAMFELIPIFGPILAAVPAIAIAFFGGGFSLALMVLVLYVIIQQFENQLIYPLVVKKVIGVPPIVSILALIAGAQLAGFWGIILSIPLAAIFMEFLSDIDKEKEGIRAKSKV